MPIAYSTGLEEIEREVRQVVRLKAFTRYKNLVYEDTFKYQTSKLQAGISQDKFKFVHLWRLIVLYAYHRPMLWRNRMTSAVEAASGAKGEVDWMAEFLTFKRNISLFCRDAV